ncbi:MAG TPA: hypothetical protein VKB86_06010 [Pyrinomonadaceae bacterium]|nr:hypothetical protein [Pyrinomonadaceae bacterium]
MTISANPIAKRSIEVAFRQGDRPPVISAVIGPDLHVRIPPELKPGDVQLQTRTLREGVASDWSKVETYQISEERVTPFVDAIEINGERSINLWPGPDKPESFETKAGARLVLHGQYPVGDVGSLAVRLDGSGGQVILTTSKEEKDSGRIKVDLPQDLPSGDWRLIILNSEDKTETTVPVVMRIN